MGFVLADALESSEAQRLPNEGELRPLPVGIRQDKFPEIKPRIFEETRARVACRFRNVLPENVM